MTIDSDGHRHVFHGELVNRFHAEVFKCNHFGLFDRAADEISRPTNRHQIGHFVPADDFNRVMSALCLSDHGKQTEIEHHLGEFVHAGRGGRASWADDFAHDGVNRADIIDGAALEFDR